MSDQSVPPGYKRWEGVFEVYTNGDTVVLLGDPEEAHNCDQMGCGSVSNHVIGYAVLATADSLPTGIPRCSECGYYGTMLGANGGIMEEKGWCVKCWAGRV